ncbi:MAG: 2-polyprenylphenol 6-hydroxylase [Gammaproteobacteria bacterium]|nr:2-polyprenylphenol 6-hydroxylase [Gammaproteobacteria bacterium]|tara:strand:+ start:46709 stop:48358 length:1650 start_codon:yes stop_codon:yes gene_type:complete
MINNFLRILQIFYLFIKHDLDKILINSKNIGSKKFIFYIFPWNWFGRKRVDDYAIKLRSFFEDLGPIFIKLGQMVSTRKDLLPETVAFELSKLQDKVKPFPGNESIKVIENDLDKKLTDIFSDFDFNPIASASIAQVHSAQLLDGSDVIVKVVRPGIEKRIKKDILLMKRIASYLDSLSEDFHRMHLNEIVSDYEAIIYDELDLIKEATNAKQMKQNFVNSNLLYIPEIYWKYVTKNILVMERTYAIPINNKNELIKNNINFEEIARKSVELFFIQVFEHNFFHADMHPGNIFIQKNKKNIQFVLVDFGIVGSLSEFDKRYLAENFVAFFNRDYAKVARLHVECEWVPKDTNISKLESAIRDNCESMLDRPLKDVSLSEIIIGLFDTARRFKLEVQPQLILMQKTLLYTEGLGREFFPELDLWKTSKPILEKWMKKQKGFKSTMEKIYHNSSDFFELMPEVPTMIRKIMNLVNKDKLDLNRNLIQLENIEKQIRQNQMRNYWYFSTIIFIFFIILFGLSFLGVLPIWMLNYIMEVFVILLILFIYFRPK